ncbi:P-loop containing nucleoside triphosphatehydrolases superfamily protein [Striga asiatica]|uniref:P-loop containing nucleoside triphosphatehydrolases superfamily protein n=1 Tax=Striga asiatica TaxID=4170 RepID=A0A5A7PN10_STRAF|nr:P-loop containing nucleoside triphosphatehydrolases superfamily protein [Striga asiatica]
MIHAIPPQIRYLGLLIGALLIFPSSGTGRASSAAIFSTVLEVLEGSSDGVLFSIISILKESALSLLEDLDSGARSCLRRWSSRSRAIGALRALSPTDCRLR